MIIILCSYFEQMLPFVGCDFNLVSWAEDTTKIILSNFSWHIIYVCIYYEWLDEIVQFLICF